MSIQRIVQMRFQKEKLPAFLQLFEENKNKIRQFPGCKGVQLWQDKSDPCHLATYSLWESEEALEEYRNSDLFKGVWARTKEGFSDKPQAVSYQILDM